MTQSHLNTAILPQPRTDRSARFRFPVLNEWLPATVTFVGFALLVALSISGCGGGSKGDSGGGANPISVTASASSRTIDAGNSINLTATVSNDKTSSGVKWNLSGPGALSNPSAGSVTYTAPPPAPASATATITATSVADASKSAAVTITIPAKPSISTTSLVAGSVGLPYSVQLNATGGIPPYAWTLMAGTLPACITFNSAGVLASSGALVGSCSGTANLTFKVTDSGKPIALTDTLSMDLVVNAAPHIVFAGAMPATALPGTPYTGSAAANGGAGALTYSIDSGNLPAGLSLSVSTGAVTGTPTIPGTYTFTVKAADAFGDAEFYPCQIIVVAALALNAANLPSTGTLNVPYTGTIVASGGTGNYAWQVTGLPNFGLSGTHSGNTLTISGNPNSQASVNFTVQLTDTGTQAVVTQAYTISISTPTPVVLPAVTLPNATVNQPYSTSIAASGGAGPYTWSINGAAVTAAGLSLTNGLTATNAGSNSLVITGTPTTANSVTLANVHVTDSLNTAATQSYTITVNGPGSAVTGHIYLASFCGTVPPALPPITVTLDTTPALHATTDSNGNFTFTSVPDGTWTATPSTSGPPVGPNSVFNPASTQVRVDNTGQSNGLSFAVMLGYNVSGSVAYHGSLTGQTYLNLIGNCSNGSVGTSLSPEALASGGAFTLHGVAPGTYRLQAWMDPSTLDNGAQNVSDPAGSASDVNVSTTNITGIAVTMIDPPLTAPTAGPSLRSITPTNTGVVISYADDSVVDSSTGKEAFSTYTVQWSTSSTFAGTPSNSTFRAVGTAYSLWILSNGNTGMSGSLASGAAYYFRVRGANSAGSSNWVYWGGPGNACTASTCAVAVTVGEPSNSSYASVTGTIGISTEMTPLITGPLYAGYYDPNTGIAYAYVVQNPIIGDNGYSIPVLKSATTGYIPFGILDQNKNGLIDTGDVTNFTTNPPPVIINGSTTGLIELSYLYELGRVQTHYVQNTWYRNGAPNTTGSYRLKFVDIPDIKRPVSVQLVSGPHVVTPMDIGNFCPGSGAVSFCNEVYLGGATPQLGDNYGFRIVLSDGTLWDGGASIIGFSGSSVVTGSSNVPTNLVPAGDVPGQTQPTFSWTYPAPASPWAQPVKYQFWLCCNGNYAVWWIPGYSSGLDGFTSSQIAGSIPWAVDPTDGTNKPNPTSLTTGTSYTWQIQGQDEFGNVAASQTSFIP